jgi:hypothetical protein
MASRSTSSGSRIKRRRRCTARNSLRLHGARRRPVEWTGDAALDEAWAVHDSLTTGIIVEIRLRVGGRGIRPGREESIERQFGSSFLPGSRRSHRGYSGSQYAEPLVGNV